MTFGTRLHQALIAAKKSRKALALHLNVSPQAIGMVITGGGKLERRLSPENTRLAVDFLGADFQWLSTGEQARSHTPAQPIDIAGLSPEAVNLAVFFDMLTNRIDRTIVQNLAMTEILRLLDLRGVLPKTTPTPVDAVKKQAEQSPL